MKKWLEKMESTVILHQANYKNYIRKGEKRMENIINDINIANLLKNITSEDLERMEPGFCDTGIAEAEKGDGE